MRVRDIELALASLFCWSRRSNNLLFATLHVGSCWYWNWTARKADIEDQLFPPTYEKQFTQPTQ